MATSIGFSRDALSASHALSASLRSCSLMPSGGWMAAACIFLTVSEKSILLAFRNCHLDFFKIQVPRILFESSLYAQDERGRGAHKYL